MPYALPDSLANTQLATQVQQPWWAGVNTAPPALAPAQPHYTNTSQQARPLSTFETERQKLIDTIKMADPGGYQSVASMTANIDTDIGNSFMRDFISEITGGVAMSEAYTHLQNKLKDLRGNATDKGLLWGSTAAPFLTNQLSKVTGRSVAEFIVPQTDFEAALTLAGIGKGISAGVRAGRSAARIAAGESAEEIGGGLAAFGASKAYEASGAPDVNVMGVPLGQSAAGLLGGLGGGMAGGRTADVGARRSNMMPDDIDPEVERLAFGGADPSGISTADIGNIKQGSILPAGEYTILGMGESPGTYRMTNQATRYEIIDGDKRTVAKAENPEELFEHLNRLGVRVVEEQSPTMRRALSTETLQPAASGSSGVDPNDIDNAFRRGDTTFSFEDPTYGKINIVKDGDDYYEIHMDADALDEYEQHIGVGSLWGAGTLEDVLRELGEQGIIGRNMDFTDVNARVAGSDLSTMTPERLRAYKDESIETMRKWGRQLEEAQASGNTTRADSLERAIDNGWNSLREIDDYIAFREDPNYSGPLRQMRNDMPDLGGGPGAMRASTGVGYTRDITEVMNEVVSNPDSKMQSAFAAAGVNPSLRAYTPVQKAQVALARLSIEDQSLTEAHLQAAWDVNATAKPRGVGIKVSSGNDIFKLDKNNHMTVTHVTRGSEKVPWQYIFERPAEYKLTPQQSESVFRFHAYIDDVLMMRENSGLPPIKKSELMKDVLYVPRQALEVRGETLERNSRFDIRRSYADIREAAANDVYYAGPRDTLEIFEKTVRREISNQQFETVMRPFGPKPTELVPEPIRVQKDKAHKELLAVSALARKEAKSTQTWLNNYATKDVKAAQLAVQHAKRNLTFIEGQLSGRMQLASGRRQTPTSYGERIAEARGRIEAAEQVLADAKLTSRKGVPRGAKGVKSLISAASKAEIQKAADEFRKAQQAYRREMDKINAQKGGGVLSPAYFKPEVVASRKAWIEAENDYKAERTAAQQAKSSIWTGAPAAARQRMHAAEKAHNAELAAALKNSANERPVSIEEWQNRFYPASQIDELKKGASKFTDSPEGIWDWMYRIGNIRRTIATGFDFGLPFIHLLPMMVTNPRAWAKGAWYNYGTFLDPSMTTRYVENNYATIQEMGALEIPVGDVEFYSSISRGGGINTRPLLDATIGKGASATVRNAGSQVARQTIGRMAAGYNGGLLIARTEYYKAMKKTWTGTPAELAQHIRNMTGGLDSRALGVGGKQRAVESMWVALSPRLLRSTLALVGDATQGFMKHGPLFYKDPKAFHATKALATLASFVTAMYITSGYMLGQSHEDIMTGLNPLNGKKFLSHNINGQWVGLGGQVRAISQLLAGLYSAAAPGEELIGVDIGGNKPISDLIKFNSFDNPLINFMASRGAPATAMTTAVGEAVTGANITGYEEVDGSVDLFAHLGKDSLPFAVAGALEGNDAMGTAAGMVGFRSSPETPVEERMGYVENEVIPSMIDAGALPPGIKSIDELGFGEADSVDRFIRDNRPELLEAWQSYRRQFGSVFQKAQDERKQVEEEYRPSFDRLMSDLLSGKLDERAVNDQLSQLRSTLFGRIQGIYEDEAYQKALKGNEPNEMQRLASEYFDIVSQVAGNQKVLTSEHWDEVSTRQQTFLSNLRRSNPEMARRFERDLNMRDSVVDAHPIIKLKREVDDASEEYYTVPEPMRAQYLKERPELNVKRWLMYGSNLQSIQSVDLALNKESTGNVRDAIRSAAFTKEIKFAGFDRRVDTNTAEWHQFKKLLDVYTQLPGSTKAKALDKIPGLNAVVTYWGGNERLYSKEAAELFVQMVGKSSNWEQWPQYGGLVASYLMLPSSNIKGNDQPHARLIIPELDAIVAMYMQKVFDIQPEFASEAGRKKFYDMTGQDTSKFAVIPPKEIATDDAA